MKLIENVKEIALDLPQFTLGLYGVDGHEVRGASYARAQARGPARNSTITMVWPEAREDWGTPMGYIWFAYGLEVDRTPFKFPRRCEAGTTVSITVTIADVLRVVNKMRSPS